jgi:serine/threonine-protein kinase SRPK3
VLKEKYHFPSEEAHSMAGFLLPMLELVPGERANAGGMSNHAFLRDAKGMEKTKLDITLGSKGEGIEGWSTEVKKQR